MRTIWKRAAYLAVLTAGVAVAAASCTDTATSPQSSDASRNGQRAAEQKVHDLRGKYGWTGDYHTRALDHAYRQLMEQNAGSLSTASKCRLAEAALKDFNKVYRKDGRPLAVTDVSLTGTACDKGVKKQIVQGPERSALPRRNDMSADATALLAQIDGAADSDAPVQSIRSAIYAIESTAAATLSEAEAGAVISAGEVAVSSVEYWDANLGAWEAGFGGDRPLAYSRTPGSAVVSKGVVVAPGTVVRSGMSPLAKRIIKADVVGFIATVAYSWWFGPIGWESAAIRGAAASVAAGLFPY